MLHPHVKYVAFQTKSRVNAWLVSVDVRRHTHTHTGSDVAVMLGMLRMPTAVVSVNVRV